MAFRKTEKRATANTTQIVTFIVDDSGSMQGTKSAQVTEQLTNSVTTMQSYNLGSSGARFLLNICKFGDAPTEIALAAEPSSVILDHMIFTGASGRTDMPLALRWAAGAVTKSLDSCRTKSNYREDETPNPLVIFLSDGENTGSDVVADAHALRSISFKGGRIEVVAVGVGMKDEHFQVMKEIASEPEYAVNINDGDVASFLADVGATIVEGRSLATFIEKYS